MGTLVNRIFFPTGWGTALDRRNWLIFAGLCSAFGLMWAGVTYLIAAGYVATGVPAVAATLVPALTGIAAILAYYRFLRQTDELQRRVQINGLALGFGGGVYWSILDAMLTRAGMAPPDTMNALMVMVLLYMVGVTFSSHRYGAGA